MKKTTMKSFRMMLQEANDIIKYSQKLLNSIKGKRDSESQKLRAMANREKKAAAAAIKRMAKTWYQVVK